MMVRTGGVSAAAAVTQAHFDRLLNWMEQHRFAGPDPYDALGGIIKPKHRFTTQLLTQANKHSPVDFRALLGIRPVLMPKTVGLVLRACALRAWQTRDLNGSSAHYSRRAALLVNWLRQHQLRGYSGPCWNFGFPYQQMALSPTVVITAIVGRGFFELFRMTCDDELRSLLRGICSFILNDLHVTRTVDGHCYSYTPLRRDCCYNASMLAAEMLARTYSITGLVELREAARGATSFVLAQQKRDGRWNYSLDVQTGREREQVDFHQGFILDSLHDVMLYGNLDHSDCGDALERGAAFYFNRQFAHDGRAYYRLPKLWPADIHHQAQGIITACTLADRYPEYFTVAERIAQWTIRNLQHTDGSFAFRKHRFFTNPIRYMRWGQAWMLVALARLLSRSGADVHPEPKVAR